MYLIFKINFFFCIYVNICIYLLFIYIYYLKVFIPRIRITPSDVDLPFQLVRRQFPIRLAFAMTINKSQGQTIPYMGLYLLNPVFSHGQLYVALSRVQSKNNIKILVKNGEVENEIGTFTKNIVYKEIL